MAKKIDENKKSNNYDIERIRPVMDRNKLNKLYDKFKSDDDYLNYHLDNIDDTHFKYKITIVNDEVKSPLKNSDEDRSYAYMDTEKASEFIEECINENRVSSKPKAVMQNGFSKKAVDKYKSLVIKEAEECGNVVKFTKPSFEDVMNNIYVNAYNGSTYNMKENDLPDDLREDVGVIIPGLIESKEEYFEFVKRLKDRGKNGLGRSIYERYEDYEEAKELIETYKQALFNKYGSKEDFFHAKDIGGMFGAYEYYPTVKPRFKKTMRNIKLDRGINLNELASVKDMGRRIREEYEDEISQIEVDGYDYTMYDNTPPKFRDLPDDLKMFYKTDKYNINGFTHTSKFTSIDEYAQQLIRSNDPEKQIEGYRILEDIKSELMLDNIDYEANFVGVTDLDDLDINAVVSQIDFDKLMSESGNKMDEVDAIIGVDEEVVKAYKKFIETQLVEINGFDLNAALDKNKVAELVKYATRYAFSKEFRASEQQRLNMNSVAESLYVEKESASVAFGDKDYRSKYRKGENKITSYVREIADAAKSSLESMRSNADNVNMNRSTISRDELCGHREIDRNVDGFALEANPKELLRYMKNNEKLAEKIYEISSETDANGMFSERTNIDDFVDAATNASKPMLTKDLIEKGIKSKRKGGNVNEN